MRQTTKARHTLGIRGQLMWFLCFICLFLLGLFWLLSTQLLEPLYTKHIETQLTNQADSIVARLDDAIAEGKVLSSWSFGQLAVNSDFFDCFTIKVAIACTIKNIFKCFLCFFVCRNVAYTVINELMAHTCKLEEIDVVTEIVEVVIVAYI